MTKMLSARASRWSSVAVTLLLLTSAAVAQKGTVVRRDVQFKKGSSRARVSGKATWGTSYQYFFRARAGQKAAIDLSGAATFSFRLLVPPEADGEQPGGKRDDVRHWSGMLNDSGRYVVTVSNTRDGVPVAPYELTIAIR